MTAVRRSLALSALGNYVGLALQVAGTFVLARLLTPEETGIFAVAAVFAALASTFRDFGVAEYLIQEKQLDEKAIRAVVTVNIVASWLMAAVLWVGAGTAADFYAHVGVGQVMRVQAVAFLLIPFGAVTMAWFRRELNFLPITVASVLSEAVAIVVAITLALQGHSYMSLAWSSLAGVVVTVACALVLKPRSLPSWPGLEGIGRVTAFGRVAAGIYVVGQAGKGAPEMIIGRALDMAAVGIFSRAQGLVEIFNRLVLRAVMPICLPFFARSVRENGDLRSSFLQMTSYLTVIGWTAFGAMALTSYALVRIVYGPQWTDAVFLAQLLCAVAALELLYFPSKEALLALGRAREGNLLQMVIQGLRVVGLLAVIPFGLVGACIGLLLASLLGAAIAFFFLVRAGQLDLAALSQTLGQSAAVTVLALAPAALIAWHFPMTKTAFLGSATACWLAVAVTWLVSLLAVRHPLSHELRQVTALIALRAHRASRDTG